MEISDSAVPGTVVNNTVALTLDEYELSSGNNNDSVSFTVTEAQPPIKVRITNIGQISNVLNLDEMTYYFTSQIPVIRGVADPNITVKFESGGNTYQTTTDGSGNFLIGIDNPPLFRGNNQIIYYSENAQNVESDHRILRLIVGEEYFPDWLLDRMYPDRNTTTTPTITPTNSVTPTPSVFPSQNDMQDDNNNDGNNLPQTGSTTEITIIGEDGQPLANTKITLKA